MWLLIPILLYCMIFYYVRHIFIYWQLKGYPCEKSELSLLFLHNIYKREFHLLDAVNEVYKRTGERFLGIYLFFRPTLLVRDIDLARHILENSDRFFHDAKWHLITGLYKKFNLLEKIRPAFSRELCRDMFSCVEKVGDNMLNHLAETWTPNQESFRLDIEAIIRTYSNDIIGSLVYGLNVNSFKFPDNIFNQHITTLRQSNFFTSVISFSRFKWGGGKHITLLRELLQETVKHRELESTVRRDLLHLFITIRNCKQIPDEPQKIWSIDLAPESKKYLSMDALAQLAEDLMAIGLEPITTTAVFTLHEVLQQPTILRKLLQEMRTIQQTHELAADKLKFEALEDMQYLDMCIKETLRKYPGIPLIKRICSRNYRIPGTRYELAKGSSVLIPIRDIQRDEHYFPEPLHYKPERFLQTNGLVTSRANLAYGLGSRSCLAQPLATVVVKVVLTKLLLSFKVELEHPTPHTDPTKKGSRVILKLKKLSTQ